MPVAPPKHRPHATAAETPRKPVGLACPRDFAALVLPLLPELRRAARRAGAPPEEVEDVVQEALLRAWTFRARFRAGTNARAWLHAILRNAAITRHRRRHRERTGLERFQADPLAAGEAITAPGTERAALSGPLRAALDALPPTYARVVELVDLDGLAYREAADCLRCPVGTVMSRLHRGRRALRRALGTEATLLAAA